MSAGRIAGRLALTLFVWLTTAVIVSIAFELAIGRRMSALANSMALLLVAPVIFKVWSVKWTTPLIVIWCLFAALETLLVVQLLRAVR
jgi:hypothetical protein